MLAGGVPFDENGMIRGTVLTQDESKEEPEVREYVATVTSKGQLTLPIEVRRRLGVKPGDLVMFVLDQDDGRAEVRRVKETVRSVFGSIPTPPGLETGDFDDLIEEAMADHAEEFVRRMREGTK